MSRYAANTSVPVERSRAEAEKILIRYGASGFGYSWEEIDEPTPEPKRWDAPKTIRRAHVMVAFKLKGRNIRLDVPMPHEHDKGMGTKAKAEAAQRQRWRALNLVLKAKLEAVESGISTLEHEFLANVVMPDGRTIGQHIVPRLTEVVETGRLLPAPGGAT